MNLAPLRAAVLGLALAIAGVTHDAAAQTASMAQLQLELDALDTMTDTLGPMQGHSSHLVLPFTRRFTPDSGLD